MASTEPPAGPVAPRRWAVASPLPWLALALGAYFAVSFALSGLRVLELQTTTWDMGIYQQALWSTAHGRPFYEAADWETGRYGSFLQVHSAFVLYLLVPLYTALPSQFTLLAVQSAFVALAAVPLYLLGRDVSGSPNRGLLAAVVYLGYAPVLTSNLYDFHIEAFLPVGLFTVFWLWYRERYGYGLLAAVAVAATMELGPVFLAALALSFLWPDRAERIRLRDGLGRIRRRLRPRMDAGEAWPGLRGADPAGRRRRGFSGLLLLLSGIGYGVLYLLRVDLLPRVWSLPAPVAAGYVIGLTPSQLGLGLTNLPVGISLKLLAWLVALALLGFVPLLAPRALLLAAPWALFTLFSANTNYVTAGFQYGFLLAVGLMPAFVFGLPRLDPWVAAARATWVGRPTVRAAVARRPGTSAGFLGGGRRAPALPTVAAVALLLLVNGLATPADPFLQDQGPGSAYRLSYTVAPGFSSAERLAGLIPAGATVLATDNLFPLVADDAHAYTFGWLSDYFLDYPFNGSRLPQFVFLAENRTTVVPVWIANDLYNTTDYGLRGLAASTPAGALLLFELRFAGPPLELGFAAAVPQVYAGAALDPGPAAYLAPARRAPGGEWLESVPGGTGTLWTAPSATLTAGWWQVTVTLAGRAADSGAPPAAVLPVLQVTANAYAQGFFIDRTLDLGTLEATGGTLLQFEVYLDEPVIQFAVEGILLTPLAEVTLAEIEIAPGGA